MEARRIPQGTLTLQKLQYLAGLHNKKNALFPRINPDKTNSNKAETTVVSGGKASWQKAATHMKTQKVGTVDVYKTPADPGGPAGLALFYSKWFKFSGKGKTTILSSGPPPIWGRNSAGPPWPKSWIRPWEKTCCFCRFFDWWLGNFSDSAQESGASIRSSREAGVTGSEPSPVQADSQPGLNSFSSLQKESFHFKIKSQQKELRTFLLHCVFTGKNVWFQNKQNS